MSVFPMIYPPLSPPTFLAVAFDAVDALAKPFVLTSAIGFVCASKALYDIYSENNNPQVNPYLYRAVAGLVAVAAFPLVGVFTGSFALGALGCVGAGYAAWSVYQIGQVDHTHNGRVSRVYFGLGLTVSIPVIGAGMGAVKTIVRYLQPHEVTICNPFTSEGKIHVMRE